MSDDFYERIQRGMNEERMRRILAVDVRYKRCGDHSPVTTGTYQIDGRTVIVEAIEVPRDPVEPEPKIAKGDS